MSASDPSEERRPQLGCLLRDGAAQGLRAVRRWRGHRLPGPGSPPAAPEGWLIGPPGFVGIGAQKAGTSWWSSLIHEHPDVYRTGGQPKELHFFDAFWDRHFTAADAELYARYFPRPPTGTAGEWTPGYMVDFWTPELLRRAAPDTRLIAMLRDPVERYRSSMAHTDEMSRATLTRRDAMGAFQRGLYAQQLRRVYRSFPREQVLVLQYERCRLAPARELSRTFRFLGLIEHAVDPLRFDRPVNQTAGPKIELTTEMRHTLARAYAADIAALAELAPDLDLGKWPTR